MKPSSKKGTGEAGWVSSRAPNQVCGGIVFGPTPRSDAFKLNKKVKKAALRSALSARYKEERLAVLNEIALEAISTKQFVQVLDRFGLDKVLFVVEGDNLKLELSARNLPNVKV